MVEEMNKLKHIYARMADEESRFIFEKRLLLSLSGDRKFLKQMVRTLMDERKEKDVMYRLWLWAKEKGCRKIVVFGSGFAGGSIVDILSDRGVEVHCLCDNNAALHGKERHGCRIISPEELKAISKDVSIIIGVNRYGDAIETQLLDMGIPEREIFKSPGGWWLGETAQYFEPTFMAPGEQEVFVDGGVFDGADSFRFIDWCGGRYEKIYAFEPDRDNFKKVAAMFETEGDKISLHQNGLWHKTETLSFSDNRGDFSRIDETGGNLVQMVPLDEVLCGRRATFIKMDVEGSEKNAIKGATQTIQAYKPRLAICVYHKAEDIVDIPQTILDIRSDYQFYLRHYTYAHVETVLYAV